MFYSSDLKSKEELEKKRLLPKGYIFNVLLFLIFVFPNWNLASFQLGPVITNVREICLVLLPVVYFFYPNRYKSVLSRTTKYWIIIFFVLLVCTEIIKKTYYGISYFDTIKNIRIAVPLFSALLICLQGKKIDPEFCLKVISVTLIISCLITPVLVLSGIQPANFSLENRQIQVEFINQGRIHNSNYVFALIGIALLFELSEIHSTRKKLKALLIIASGLSLVIMVLFFNRTLLAATFLVGLILFIKNLSTKTIGYIAVTLIVVGATAGYFYETNEQIRKQVEKRILVVFQKEEGLAESVYYGNRDNLYAEYLKKLKNYWFLGMPGGESLIYMQGGELTSAKSDISFFNVWIRYGIISFLFCIIIFARFFLDQKKRLEYLPKGSLSFHIGYAVLFTIPFYVLVSLNVDVLLTKNSILYIILFFTFFDIEDYS